MGKKPGASGDLGAHSFILTVQSVKEREHFKKKKKILLKSRHFQLASPKPPQARAKDGAPVKLSGHKRLFV